jgi:hydrogenase maturation factor
MYTDFEPYDVLVNACALITKVDEELKEVRNEHNKLVEANERMADHIKTIVEVLQVIQQGQLYLIEETLPEKSEGVLKWLKKQIS